MWRIIATIGAHKSTFIGNYCQSQSFQEFYLSRFEK
jgi:hypothetical protein